MFYLREFYLRSKFSFFSTTLVIFICYKYKSTLFILSILSILRYENAKIYLDIDHFIYTHPAELFKTYITMILFSAVILIVPAFIWQSLDFLKPGLHCNEYVNLRDILCLFTFICFICQHFFLVVIFPQIWYVFETFNNSTVSMPSLKLLFELKVQDYLSFLFDFVFYSNVTLVLLFCLYCFINRLGLETLVQWKKLFIFINIVFATVLSPPDVYSQVLLLGLFTLLFESIIFFTF